MTQNANGTDDPAQAAQIARKFFDRADQVADTGNWDFAIQLYLEGIKHDPENVERGHQPLRMVAMNRKARGGKAAGMMEQLKHRHGKDPLANLVNAEYLLAKDPGTVANMELVLKAAGGLGAKGLMKWIADILMETQRQAPKASMKLLRVLIDAYVQIQDFGKAETAAQMALTLDPDNDSLPRIVSDLSAQYTMKKGRYDEEGDFAKGVKDLEGQQELMQQDSIVKSKGYLQQQVEAAQRQYEQSPTVAGKVTALVDALLKSEDEGCENKAIDVLAKAYKDTGAYMFKMRMGDVKMRQMVRRGRQLLADGNAQVAQQHAKAMEDFELQEFAERAANYPTDLNVKYEYGRRLLAAGKFDDAIAMLQQAQRDPRRRIQTMIGLGQAFAGKGWRREAAETYEKALTEELTEDRVKEVRYNLGVVLEAMGDMEAAQKHYSQVAMMDYNYRDVRQRLENIRNKLGNRGN